MTYSMQQIQMSDVLDWRPTLSKFLIVATLSAVGIFALLKTTGTQMPNMVGIAKMF